jgi:predicted enzyme related to lactoylglutathione lyase
MRKKMDPVIHFEIPVTDSERAGKFFEGVFGWQTTPLGSEAEDFVLAFTTETDEKTRIPQKRGAINGGFYKRTRPDQSAKLTILVDDIREAMKEIEAAGGKVTGEPFELPGVGLLVDFTDPDGNLWTINQDFTIKRLPEE